MRCGHRYSGLLFMPVRIYDIAKKFGLESKAVLAKAKELGLTHAKVASSTLDKISAEYLEEQLAATVKPPAAPVEPAQKKEIEPVKIVTEPQPEPASTETTAPATQPEADVVPQPEETGAPPPQTTEVIETPVESAPTVETATPSAVATAPPPAEIAPAPLQPEVLQQPAPQPTSAITAAPNLQQPAKPTVETAAEPANARNAASAVVAVAPVATPPAPPPKPKVGDKIGSIKLKPGMVSRPPERPSKQQPKAPAAKETPKTQQRPGMGQKGVPPSKAPAAPRPATLLAADAPVIAMRPPVSVRDLAERLNRKPFQVIADLMEFGVFANVNQTLDEAMVTRVCAKHGFRFDPLKRVHQAPKPQAAKQTFDEQDRPEDLKPRPPVVTIMGHVDHGKTTLLDVIRKSNVAAGEAGGITQHIGAYTITIPTADKKSKKPPQRITFLDTPGHAAFSKMRARGANVTDIVVLVVAANDGVMPQTEEAIAHAKDAGVPIVVAINKIDHPNANPRKVLEQLAAKGLKPDIWGGDTICVECSALTKKGVDKLLEMILFQAEMMNLKANPNRKAQGNVIEAGLEPGGPTATVLVRKGTLRVGDVMLSGEFYGKVRALINAENERLKEVGPSEAVKVLGLNGVPEAGTEFVILENEKEAREIAEKRKEENKPQAAAVRPRVSLDTIYEKLDPNAPKELKLIIKADTQGSVEAITEALKDIKSSKVTLNIIHSAVGTITESDVALAAAAKGIIIGFHTRVDSTAPDEAKRLNVEIRNYDIIYELIDDVKLAMAGLLAPVVKEVVLGAAEVRRVFPLSKGGNVAGCMVIHGRVVRGKARLVRRKTVVYDGSIMSLRHFQDEVSEMRAGMECGIRLQGFNEFQPGDVIESYTVEKAAAQLE